MAEDGGSAIKTGISIAELDARGKIRAAQGCKPLRLIALQAGRLEIDICDSRKPVSNTCIRDGTDCDDVRGGTESLVTSFARVRGSSALGGSDVSVHRY